MFKKFSQIGFLLILMFSVLSLTISASAEENGYWTMKTDDEGTPVMIYTYTKPVNWAISEDAVQESETPSQQPIAEVGQATVHYASNTPAAPGKTASSVKKDTANPLTAVLSAAGLLTVSALVIHSIIKRRKRVFINTH